MEVTWEQLDSPEKAGIKEIEGIGTVLITTQDIEFKDYGTCKLNLIDNTPESDYKVGNLEPKGQIFLRTR